MWTNVLCIMNSSINAQQVQRHQWLAPSFDDFSTSSSQKPTRRPPATSSDDTDHGSGHHRFAAKKRSRYEVDKQEGVRISVKGKRRGELEADVWVVKHAPQSQSELCVHKKKIAEVEEWLKHHASLKKPAAGRTTSPILLLTGPAGAGKTATIRVLAKELQMEVREWANPDTTEYDAGRFTQDRQDFNMIGGPLSQSQTSLFQEFLTRANRYPALELSGCTTMSHKLCLVEDIPNAFLRNPQGLHVVLRKFVTTCRSPVVFIISDSFGGESSAFKLFPKDLLASLGIATVSFNPVAQTNMVKVMTRIATTEATQGKRRFPVPSKTTIEALASASSGDIRSAINTLQFACLKDTRDLDRVIAGANPPKKSSRSRNNRGQPERRAVEKGDSEDGPLMQIGGRDTTMFLFRALGKILYCKRVAKSPNDPVLPPHLSHHDRDKLKFNPEEVVENTHMTGDTFSQYLNQNYLDFYESLDDVVAGSRYFSDSDVLTCEWRSRSDMMTYGASLTCRAVAHCNTARGRHDNTAGGGWKPLHKPQWFAIIRKYRESCTAANGLFVGQCTTPIELQTQLLPYLAIISVPLQNPGQINFLQEVTRFRQNQLTRRHRPETLNEKDGIGEDEDEDEGHVAGSSRGAMPMRHGEQANLLAKTLVEEENEVVIEDFDDD